MGEAGAWLILMATARGAMSFDYLSFLSSLPTISDSQSAAVMLVAELHARWVSTLNHPIPPFLLGPVQCTIGALEQRFP